MGYISKEDFIKSLKIKEWQCIKEIEAIRNLIALYEDVNTNRHKLKYREAREKLGMTQAELAEKVGVAIMTVSNFENGINIRQKKYDKIINALGITKSVCKHINTTWNNDVGCTVCDDCNERCD